MKRTISVTLVLALMSGCGLVSQIIRDLSKQQETGSAKLIPFGSEQELRDYFADQMTARNGELAMPALGIDRAGGDSSAVGANGADGTVGDAGAPPQIDRGADGSLTADAEATGGGFSGTTIQEVGVDESDVVKTDGTFLYLISGGKLKIIRVSPADQLGLAGEVAIQGFGQELYLHDGKVIALTNTGGGGFFIGGGGIAIDPVPVAFDESGVGASESAGGGMMGNAGEPDDVTTPGDAISLPEDMPGGMIGGLPPSDLVPSVPDEFRYERPRSVVTIVDVSAPESPTVLSVTEFDGNVSASRMIDGVLHLVLANFQDFFFDVMPFLGRPEFDAAAVSVANVVPKFSRIDAAGGESSGDVVTWDHLFRPTDPDGFGVVTLVSLDVNADATFSAVGVVAEPGLMYSSLEAAYLTDTQYDFSGQTRETTDIYKFTYADRGAIASAAGSVPGRVLNQFSMGEHQGNLRVATTVGPTFGPFAQRSASRNNVYVLSQDGDALSVVGGVENIAPRETIQSARFIGDRGYVVTFEQIDPLFTLDLSDPANPRIVGELKVPGFSTFIVPMDENHLLTVGQHIPESGPRFASGGVQLSVFDVTDFANPVLQHNVVIGADSGAFSEALFNPKAFTYFAERGLVALPLTIFPDAFFFDGGIDGGLGGLVGNSPTEEPVGDAGPPDTTIVEPTPDEPADGVPFIPPGFDGVAVYRVTINDGFTDLGRMSTRFEDAGIFWASYTRGVFIDDDVYAVTDNGVRVAPIADLANPTMELLIAEPIDFGVSGGEPVEVLSADGTP